MTSARTVGAYVRRGPLTASVLAVLVVVQAVLALTGTFAAARAWSSTNVANLGDHPVGAVATSVFFLGNAPRVTAGTVLVVGIGVGVALWWLEARRGVVAAAIAFLGGHVGATALTAVVITVAVDAGRYPPAVLTAPDVGVSYAAQSAAAAAVVLLPRWWPLPGAVAVLTWPLLDASWSGALPDFTSVGHLVAAVIGFGVGVVVRRRPRVSNA